MALMASMRPSCTTLPAALREKHLSRGEPRQRFLNVSGLPSEWDFGLSWLCLGELLAALGRLLAALGLPRQPLGRLCGPFWAALGRCAGFRASPARLQRRFGAFWGRPRLDFLCVPLCFGEHFGPQALDALLPGLLRHRCVVRPLWSASAPSLAFCTSGGNQKGVTAFVVSQ